MPTEQNKILDGLKQQLTTASQTLSSMSAPKISASSLTSPVAPLQIPQYTPPAQTPFVPQPLVQATEDARVAMQKSQDELSSLYDTMGTQSQRKQQLETAQGIPAINSRLSELNALDAQYAAELTGITANELKQNVTGDLATNYAPLRNAISAQDTRLNIQKQQSVNIKRATNAAAIAAANGQLALAQNYVQKAMDYEFKPLEYQLQYKTMIYEQNREHFTKAEQRQYDAQLAAEKQNLDQQKEDRSVILAMAAAASKNFPTDQTAQFAIQQAIKSNDVVEAFNLIGRYQSDPMVLKSAILDNQYKQAQINKLNADVRKINAEAAGAAIPSINGNGAKYSGALSVILGSTKLTKEQKATLINAVNNGEDPAAVLKNQAKQVMTGSNQTKIESYETAQQALSAIDQSLHAYYAAGGKTNLFTGNYEKVINKLGEVNDPNLVNIATQIQQNLQVYRNAVSGTAYSVQEGNDIAAIFPGINKSQGLNRAIIDGRTKAMNDTIDAAYRGVLGSTYDTLKTTQNAPQQTNPQTSIPVGAIRITRNGQEGYITNMMEFNPKTDKRI